jgi:hypothetical protein
MQRRALTHTALPGAELPNRDAARLKGFAKVSNASATSLTALLFEASNKLANLTPMILLSSECRSVHSPAEIRVTTREY